MLFLSVLVVALLLPFGNHPARALSRYQTAYRSLKDLVVTPEEMKKYTDLSTPSDVTKEISEACFYDCVKMKWGTNTNGLTLLMIRSSNSANAEKSAQNLRAIYQSFGDNYRSYSDSKDGTKWSGELHSSNNNKLQWVSVDTQGPVLIFFSYRKVLSEFVADIDAYFYQNLVESLTSVQKQKLRDAGYTE